MFGFKKKLDTVTADLLGKMDQALEMASPVDRLEKLLTLKEETSETLSKIERRENNKGIYSLLTGIIIAIPAQFVGAIFLGDASQFISAASSIFGGIAIGLPFTFNRDKAIRYKNELTEKLDTKISALIEESPAIVLQSPKLLAQLKSAFSPAASTPALDKIKAAVTLTSPAIEIQPPAKRKIYLE